MKFLYYINLFLLALPVSAQELLTVEDAVKIALENNYDIRISKNELRVDQANVTIGNAGILPSVSANVVDNNGIQNSSQTRSDGTTNKLDNAKNNNLNYGIGLNWTVFDGFRMFARYDELQELQKLGESELKLTVLNKVSDVMNMYFDLVQQQAQLRALDTTLVISKERVTLAQNRFTIGKASKLEVLNAQVDLNTDETAILRQKETYANTKITLNEILARETTVDFKVADTIVVDSKLELADLNALAQKQNPQLLAQIISKRVAELQLKQVKAARYPTIGVSTGYNFIETQSSLGFTTETSSRGLTYGFTASLNLFDGLNQQRNEKVAKIQIENSDLLIQQQNQAIMSQLATAFQTYLTNIKLIALEQRNEEIAKENLQITLDKFKIGNITTIEVRTAQLNYVNAKVRNSDAQYQAKLSEIALKELAGNLTF